MADRDQPLLPGKLPAPILGRLLSSNTTLDDSVVIGPGVGRDAAALRVGDRVIVVKTDPITFPTADAGRYLVNVNANDIACMGARPRWLLVTALLPELATTETLVERIFSSLMDACATIGVALVGGHSEITLGLDRPILVGQMIGECDEGELLDLSRSAMGDAILLCSGIAIEGTAILATEAADALRSVPRHLMERAEAFLKDPGISVLPAANALRDAGVRIRGMHDPTEGGIAAALAELAAASGRGVEVDLARILVLDETAAICEALGLDPLGLIASGALLAVVDAAHARKAVDAVCAKGIEARVIGTMLERGEASRALDGNGAAPLPHFDVDEIARYFASA